MRLPALGLLRQWLRPRALLQGSRALGTAPDPLQFPDGDDYLEAVGPWSAGSEAEQKLLLEARQTMRVLPEFVSEAEEAALMTELEPYLKKMRYEFDHWDDAIHGYKETERRSWTPPNAAVLARVVAAAFPGGRGGPGGAPQPHVHVLDLAPGGHIKPHIDATRYCGAVIAGLCLLSPAVMRLSPPPRPDLALLALLPRRALYIMSGAARYELSHAVAAGEHGLFRGLRVRRSRRVALITRSAPPPAQEPPGPFQQVPV